MPPRGWAEFHGQVIDQNAGQMTSARLTRQIQKGFDDPAGVPDQIGRSFGAGTMARSRRCDHVKGPRRTLPAKDRSRRGMHEHTHEETLT